MKGHNHENDLNFCHAMGATFNYPEIEEARAFHDPQKFGAI